MSVRISSFPNPYRVPPVYTDNRTGKVSRNRPRESRGKAVKKQDQCKILQLDIRSQEVEQVEQSDAIFKTMDMTGQAVTALAIVVGAICLVVNVGRAFG